GTYVFRLTVVDDEGDSGFDQVTVTVIELPNFPIRLNAGGSSYDFNGDTWLVDQYFSGGSVFNNAIDIANTSNDQLYQSERFTTSSSFAYEIPMVSGEYDVELHFAEIFFGVPGEGSDGGVGSRIFNVSIENGQGQLNNYDIVVAAGGSATAIVERFTGINVTDGSLTITLTAVVEFPKISGIGIFESGAAKELPIANAGPDLQVNLPDDAFLIGSGTDPDGGAIVSYQWTQESGPSLATLTNESTSDLLASDLIEGTYVFRLTITDDEGDTAFDETTITVSGEPVVLRLNSGGPALTFNGEDWLEDQFFNAGSTFTNSVEIENTTNDELYQTERFRSASNGPIIYEIPVPQGNYNVDLHFAELFFGLPNGDPLGGVGSRIFNIDIENGQRQLNSYDIVEAAGGSATAVVESFSGIFVNDGNLTITLTSIIQNPKISGIGVFGTKPPIVDAGEDQEITLPINNVLLNGNAIDPDGGAIANYLWTQQSGPSSATLSGEATPNLTISNVVQGEYVFRLTATDDDNEVGFDEVTIVVNQLLPPVAVATAVPLTGSAPLEVAFTGSGSTDDLGIVSYLWDFKDGNTSTDIDPIHIFSLPGIYDVELMVTDGDGLFDIDTIVITVNSTTGNQAPVAVATANPLSGDAPLTVNFTGSTSTDDVAVTSYVWDFGDGSPIVSTADPVHTFTVAGVFEVTLTVEDAEGLSDVSTISITVNSPLANQPPVAVASATPLSGDAPLTVNFTGSTSTDDVAVTSYVWDFGDGTSSTEPNPTHTFTTVGVFNVTLMVQDVDGLSDTATITITVIDPTGNQPPVAQISAAPVLGNVPLEVIFTGDNSTDDVGIVSYIWDFGDGATSTEPNPIHTFTTIGEFDVTLTVSDIEGFAHIATIRISVQDGSVEESDKMKAIIAINPANNVALVQLQNKPATTIITVLSLHDASGRWLGSYDPQTVFIGDDTYEIPIGTLRDGVYYVNVEMNDGTDFGLKLLVKNR
ncbi:PKD domain-containing protein, partial [Arenibacter sp. GZD96]|uniref:PKD domain-containing protein n=1 Tax=Aurantibrevibacter litoralis TaxID=3106030 RepID=UPI002AFDDE17